MTKCDMWHEYDKILGWSTPDKCMIDRVAICYATKEKDECACGGDKTKCDFYDNYRYWAIKEQVNLLVDKEPQFFRWYIIKNGLTDDVVKQYEEWKKKYKQE